MMSMQIPDYSVFAQMPVSARRQSLEMIKRFAGQVAATLYLQVYQFDPDAELREFARRELAAQGIVPPTESTPMTVAPASSSANFGSAPYAFSSASEDAIPASASQIDGGTGRPVQRGPQLANIFTLFHGHEKYLTGERHHLPHSPFVYLFLTGIFGVIFVIMFVAFRGFGSIMTSTIGFNFDFVLWLVGGIFGFILLIFYGVWIYNIRRNRRYERNGTLLLGKVMGAQGRWHSSTNSNGGSSRSYRVTIAYRVRLPDGTIFDNTESHSRGDLANGGLPMAGTPVALLVIDKDNMRLL